MKFAIFLCLIVVALGERNVIESPQVTPWGIWHNMSRCDEDHPYVHGFQLATQSYQGGFTDDTAMNGINLFCDKIGGISTDFYIRSGMEYRGTWGSEFFCGGIATGFQMRSEAQQGAIVDDTAANNLRIFCNGKESFMIQGDGTGLGLWTAAQHCKERQALCGISTQVEAAAGRLDETALNNIRLECCNVQTPAEECKPSNEWELVGICNNKGDSNSNKCQIERRVGVSYSQKRNLDRPHAQIVYQQLGFTLEEDLCQLETTFNSKGKSNIKGFQWTKNEELWNKENVNELFVPMAPFSTLKVYQLKGECGIYSVRSNLFKNVEIGQSGETKINYSYL